MNIENRAVKVYLKSLAPNELLALLDKYNIPSPYKEILITVCIYNKSGFAGVDFLAEHYNIHLSYWTFVRRVKEALNVFRTAHRYNCQ